MSTQLSNQELDQVIALQILACLHAETIGITDSKVLLKSQEYEIFAKRSFLWGAFKLSKETIQHCEELLTAGKRTLLRPTPSIELQLQSRVQMHLEKKMDFFHFVEDHTGVTLNDGNFMKHPKAIEDEIRRCRERNAFRNIPGAEEQVQKSTSHVIKTLKPSTFIEDSLSCFQRLFKGQTLQPNDDLLLIILY